MCRGSGTEAGTQEEGTSGIWEAGMVQVMEWLGLICILGAVNKPYGGLDMGCKGGERRLRDGSYFFSLSTGMSNNRTTH